MDIQPKQPISDDQELAKVLAGITAGADGAAATTDLADNLEQEAASTDSPATSDDANTTAADSTADNSGGNPVANPAEIAMPDPIPTPAMPAPAAPSGDLESIKSDALKELRPLVDKLNVSPEEKFDTYLLIIRSTDDSSLIGPAHEAARNIADEARRAQALLDVIKEIDYLSNPQKQAV